jgi:hypothetical protein
MLVLESTPPTHTPFGATVSILQVRKILRSWTVKSYNLIHMAS